MGTAKENYAKPLMRKKERVTTPPVFYKEQSEDSEVLEVCNIARFVPGELSSALVGEQS